MNSIQRAFVNLAVLFFFLAPVSSLRADANTQSAPAPQGDALSQSVSPEALETVMPKGPPAYVKPGAIQSSTASKPPVTAALPPAPAAAPVAAPLVLKNANAVSAAPRDVLYYPEQSLAPAAPGGAISAVKIVSASSARRAYFWWAILCLGSTAFVIGWVIPAWLKS